MDRQTQLSYLKTMGIPVWTPRTLEAESVEIQSHSVDHHESNTNTHTVSDNSPSRFSSLMDHIDNPSSKTDTTSLHSETQTYPNPQGVDNTAIQSMDWETLKQTISECQRCDLHRTRMNTVFNAGTDKSDLMIIGEAPGAEEDRRGEPFVGKAGQLLNNMLKAMNITRGQICIANILKCRPPNNRDPRIEEVIQCRGYLERQIEWVDPKVILVVGRIAAQTLLDTKEPLARLRGKPHSLKGEIPVIVTYHPAYLLRQPRDKRKTWLDLNLLLTYLDTAP